MTPSSRIWKHSVLPYIEERRFGESDLEASSTWTRCAREVRAQPRRRGRRAAGGRRRRPAGRGRQPAVTRRIDLTEYETRASRNPSRPPSATPSVSCSPSSPPRAADAAYRLTPGSTVGAVETGGLSVLIRPKIGIPQLLSLACYAIGAYRPQPEMFDFGEHTALPDALALALASHAHRAFLSRAPPRLPPGGGGAAHRARARQVRRPDTAQVRRSLCP